MHNTHHSVHVFAIAHAFVKSALAGVLMLALIIYLITSALWGEMHFKGRKSGRLAACVSPNPYHVLSVLCYGPVEH